MGKWVGLFLFLIVILGIIVGKTLFQPKERVLGLVSPTVEMTPAVTLNMTPSPASTASAEVAVATKSAVASVSATPKPTKRPTLKPTPTAESAEVVYGLVERFASQYGVDPDVLRYMALCESGFRSNAVNGPYVGLFQFGSVTWTNMRKEMGEESNPDLRFSAEESVQTAAYALSKGKEKIWPNCMPK